MKPIHGFPAAKQDKTREWKHYGISCRTFIFGVLSYCKCPSPPPIAAPSYPAQVRAIQSFHIESRTVLFFLPPLQKNYFLLFSLLRVPKYTDPPLRPSIVNLIRESVCYCGVYSVGLVTVMIIPLLKLNCEFRRFIFSRVSYFSPTSLAEQEPNLI